MGLMPYGEALALQQALRRAVLDGETGDTLLLLEHPPVITLGRSARRENLLASPERLRARGVELFNIHRGGDVTLHAPGQLVGYPVRQVGRAIRPHVEGMARAVQALLAEQGVVARWRDDHPGIWTESGKIAAVGVDAREGVAIHGFAVNLSVDLDLFSLIVPCGLQAPVASLASLGVATEGGHRLDSAAVAPRLAGLLAQEYGVPAREISPGMVMDRAREYLSP